MGPTNQDVVGLNVEKVSLVGQPANDQNFLGIKKAANQGISAAGAASRSIQDLLANPNAGINEQDLSILQQIGEFLKSLDSDQSAELPPTAGEQPAQPAFTPPMPEAPVTPGMVRESLESFLIASTPEMQESLRPEFWKAFDVIRDLDEPPVLITIPKGEARHHLQESARFLSSVDPKGWEWDVCIIESGDSKNGVWDGGNFVNRHYPLDTLKQSAHLFEGARVYVYERKISKEKTIHDHLSEDDLSANPHGYAKDLVGWISRPRIDGNSLVGTVRLLKNADWLRVNLQDSVSAGKSDLYGLSIDSDGSQHLGRVGGKARLVVDALHDVRSVDVVTYPAAGGRFLRLVASRNVREIQQMPNELELKLARFEERQALNRILQESRLPTLVQAKIRKRFMESESIDFDALEVALREANMAMQSSGKGGKVMSGDDSGDFDQANEMYNTKEVKKAFTGWKDVDGKQVYFVNGVPGEPPAAMQESWLDKKLARFSADLDKKINAFAHHQKLNESQDYLINAVQGSNLPPKAQEKILRMFKGRVVESAIIDREIEDMRDLTASSDNSGDLRIGGQSRDVRVTESEWDKRTAAFDGFWANQDLKGTDGRPVRRMRSLQEAFEVMTGKRYTHRGFIKESLGIPGDQYDSAGRYGVQANRMTESLTTSSWAQILGDSITRRMLAEYNVPSLQNWRQIVSEVGTIKDFRTQRRMRIGGYGLLPTVGQADSYTPLTSPTDEEATYAVSKKGGTETVTLEMMANDDVGAMRRIPLRLGRAAAQTLYRTVFDLIKDNTAVSFTDDTLALFHASHANIGSTALNPDSLEAALIRMKRQAAYGNTTEVLGLVPRFILHPPDLWRTVDKIVKSKGEPFTEDNDENPFLQLKLQPIEIYYWTDTDNWYLVANPSDIPTIEVGFFEGNEDPEIFVSDQENISNSSMFSADKITYKIRHIYGVGILEYRGFDGNLVS
jgi:hypothetical protein